MASRVAAASSDAGMSLGAIANATAVEWSFKAVCCVKRRTFPFSVETCHGFDLSSLSFFICE